MIVFLCFFIIFLTTLLIPKPLNQSPPLTVPVSPIKTEPKQATLLAVGDIMLGRHCNVTSLSKNDWYYPFLTTADFTSKADLAFGNLEAPFVQDCPQTSTGMLFCAPPQSIEGLNFGGFDLVSLANNHMLNYGPEGLEQTKEILDQNQISYTDSQGLTVKTLNGVTFGFLAFDLVTYPPPRLSVFGEASQTVDILIVSLHWGNEYQKTPTTQQIELAHQLIDSGVKIIIGHHPHVTQPVEEYNEGLIFYSLGNFIFDQAWSEETKKGAMAEIIFTGKEIKSYELYPVYSKNFCQPQLVNENMN